VGASTAVPAKADVIVIQDSGGANPNTLGFTDLNGGVAPGRAGNGTWDISGGSWNTNYALYTLSGLQVSNLIAATTWTFTATFSNLSTNLFPTVPGAPYSRGSYAAVCFHGVRFDLELVADSAGNQILVVNPFIASPYVYIPNLGTGSVTLSVVYNNRTQLGNVYVNGIPVLQSYRGNTAVATSSSFVVFGGENGSFSNVELSYVASLDFIGSIPHIAAQENWTTTFTLVNKTAAAADMQLSLFGDATDASGTGPLTLPLIFPQQLPIQAPLSIAVLDRNVSANASLIVQTAGPQTPPVQVGSAQLTAAGAMDGFAIFHLIPGAQEAVIPLETRNANSYLLVFDNTGGVVLGVAVENVSSQAATIPVIIRDDTGMQIRVGTLEVPGSGHTSFVLSLQYPETAGKRGTIEFDAPAAGQIGVLGIRTTPLGTSTTLTTIPALANVGTTGGSIAHIASGNGWQTTFVLVNTGTSMAQIDLQFFADVTGLPLSLPLSFPQSGGSVADTSSVVQTLGPRATLLVQSAGPLSNPAPTIGSAQLTTNGNVGGFVIFRYNPNGQEAVVPLENRSSNSFLVAFDNTGGTATGIAINSISAKPVSVSVVIRDDTGTVIGTDTAGLAANGHMAFTLVADKYAATANIRGTIEFDTPTAGQIGVLGIRIPVAHTFTTLPALAK
jgi:hypothetical protein